MVAAGEASNNPTHTVLGSRTLLSRVIWIIVRHWRVRGWECCTKGCFRECDQVDQEVMRNEREK